MKDPGDFLRTLFEGNDPNHKLTPSQMKTLDVLLDRLGCMWEIVWDRCSTSKEVAYLYAFDRFSLEENLKDYYSHDELLAISRINNVKTGESYQVDLVFSVSLSPID